MGLQHLAVYRSGPRRSGSQIASDGFRITGAPIRRVATENRRVSIGHPGIPLPMPRRVTRPDLLRDSRKWSGITGAGLAASLAGYAIFFIVYNIQFTLAGEGNRVSMSAAAGIAVTLVGVIGWALANLPAPSRSLQTIAFASLVALLTASGCIVNYAISSFWTAAYRRQTTILAATQNHFGKIPEGGTLLLDGVCGFVGPAVVFEFDYDFTGALRLLYRNRSLHAGVVTPKLKVAPDGLETENWGGMNKYKYEKDLIVYNVSQESTAHITDEKSAEQYFSKDTSDWRADCSRATPGVGLPIF